MRSIARKTAVTTVKIGKVRGDERRWAGRAFQPVLGYYCLSSPRPRPRFRPRLPTAGLVAAHAARLRRAGDPPRPSSRPAPRAAPRLAIWGRAIRARPELDRDRVHLSGGHARLARLARRRAARPLPRRLPRPCRRPRLALRSALSGCARGGAGRRLGADRVAPRHHVHRLRLEPGRGRPGGHFLARDLRRDRNLRLVDAGRAARRRAGARAGRP